MDEASRRRLLERVREHASEHRNERVFRKTASEVSEDPDVFINVKKLPEPEDYNILTLKSMSFAEREEKYGEDWYKPFWAELNAAQDQYKEDVTKAVIGQLNDQKPGLGDAFEDYIEEGGSQDFDDFVIGSIVAGSPAAWSTFEFEGQPVCVIKEPSEQWDNARSFIIETFENRPLLNHVDDSVVKNFGISDFLFNKGVAAHEGQHCNQDKDDLGNEREKDSDAVELEVVGDEDYASAIKDYRHLSAHSNSTVHAVGTLLEYEQSGTEIHAEGAYYHSSKIALMAYENYEWKGDLSKMTDEESWDVPYDDEWQYKALEPDYDEMAQVLEKDPDGFFKAVNEGIDAYKKEVMDRYKEDPSHDNLRAVIRAEVSIDYMQNFEAAYKRRFLGQMDTPVPAQTLLVDVDREAFFERDGARSELIAKAMTEVDVSITGFEEFAFQDFDFTPYQGDETDFDFNDLRIENPDKYFEVLNDAEIELLHSISKDQKPEDVEALTFLVEEVVNTVRQYEYNYRTKYLGEIAPEPRNVDFLKGDGEERALIYIEKLIKEEDAQKAAEASSIIEPEEGVNASDSDAENDLAGWESVHEENFVSGGAVSGQNVQTIKPIGF